MRKILTVAISIFILGSISQGSYESAYSKYMKDDVSGAVAEITKDILNNVKDPRLYFLMIRISKEKTKDYTQAVEYAISGMKIFPEYSKEFMLELSDAYILSGKSDKAEPILINYNSLYPGDPRCLYLLGKNYYNQKKYYRALVSLEAARSFGKNDLELLEILGMTYSKVGNYQKSLEILSYVYNQTKQEKILAKIIEISSIMDVDYSSYITIKGKVPEIPSSTRQTSKPLYEPTYEVNQTTRQIPLNNEPTNTDNQSTYQNPESTTGTGNSSELQNNATQGGSE